MTARRRASGFPVRPDAVPSQAGFEVERTVTVRVTRGRHPLQGCVLPVLGRMRRHGRLELLLVLPDGSKSLLPAEWTDCGEAADAGTGEGEPVAATVGSLADLLHARAVARF